MFVDPNGSTSWRESLIDHPSSFWGPNWHEIICVFQEHMSSIPIRFKRRIGSRTFDAHGQSLKLERDNKFSCSLVLHIVSIMNFSISDNGPKIK